MGGRSEDPMTEAQVKEIVGTALFPAFLKWMRGQTVGVNPDGSTDYYEVDVDGFISQVVKLVNRTRLIVWD